MKSTRGSRGGYRSTTEFVHTLPATLGEMSKLAALPMRLKESAMPKAVATSAPLNQRAVMALWATDTLSPPRPNTWTGFPKRYTLSLRDGLNVKGLAAGRPRQASLIINCDN